MRRKWPGWVGSVPILFGATNVGLAAVAAQNTYYSSNWSGYLATPPSGDTFTDVDSTWVIPTVVGSSSSTTYSADWVGFDGVTDGTVEQCGTSGDFVGGGASYYAWYEFYPQNEVLISSLPVHAGDTMTAEVTYEASESTTGSYAYFFDLDDVTTGQSFTDTLHTSSNDARSSAEWIAEAPTVNGAQATFANYSSVTFSNDVAAAVPAGSTSIGTDQAMGAFSTAEVFGEQNGGYVSVPTSFNSTGESFNVIYGANLIWDNANASSPDNGQTWDISNNANWSSYFNPSTSISSPAVYTNGVNVTFNDLNNGHYAVTLNTTVSPASVSVAASGNYTISGSGTIAGTGYLIKTGTGTLTLSTPDTYTGGTTVTNGRLLIEPTSPTTSALPTGALSISGGTVQLADNVTAGTALATSNVVLTSLSLSGTGTLDIGNNRIIIDYTTGHDPIASVEQWIENGFYDLSGPSIISSDIAADDAASGLSYGIGYADGADGVVTGLPSGEIEVMLTLLGDANLDGQVNSEDFTLFSDNFGESGVWDQGDFNYAGTINAEDFTLFSHNLGQSAALAAAAGNLVQADGISLANVPEPASAAVIIAFAGTGFLRRRRRSLR
jgi:autotransporter-associated beta strand protein